MSFCQYSFLPLHSIIFTIKYTFSHKRGAHTFSNNILTFWKHTVINVGAPTPVGGRMQPAIIQSHAPHGFILGVAIFEARSARKLSGQRAQQQRAVVLGGQLDRLLALILRHLQILDRHSLSAKSVQTHSKYTQNAYCTKRRCLKTAPNRQHTNIRSSTNNGVHRCNKNGDRDMIIVIVIRQYEHFDN